MWSIIILILFILAVIGIVKFAKAYTFLFILLLVFLISIIVIRIVLRTKKKRKIKSLYENIQDYKTTLLKESNKSIRINMIQLLAESFNQLIALGEFVRNEIEEIHKNFLFAIIKDCTITDDEKEVLKYLEKTFSLSSENIRNNRRSAYTDVYEWAIKDRKLTENEENILRNIFLQLDISPDDVAEEQAFLKDLSLARQLAGKELKPIETPFSLNQNEQCFFSISDACLYKSRKKNYEYHRDNTPVLMGKLYVTNHRIIINAPGEYNRSLISEIDMLSIEDDSFIRLDFKRKNNIEFIKVSKPYLTKVVIVNYLNKVRS